MSSATTRSESDRFPRLKSCSASSLYSSASWYDSGVQSGDPPYNGSCYGSYRNPAFVDSGWQWPLTALTTPSGNYLVPRTPEADIYAVEDASSFGSCNRADTEIIEDTMMAGVDTPLAIHITLPLATLRHAGRRVVIPINLTRSGPVAMNGVESSNPGAVSTVTLSWHGGITYSRAYTCSPHNCVGPQNYS